MKERDIQDDPKQMVQSDTGRLHKERKELARSCKERIWEIRRVWRPFVKDSHETDMMYFCSCIFFITAFPHK